MKRLRNLLRVNPIIVKELRSRMRGGRAFITLTVILLVMAGIMYAMLQIILANARYSNIMSPQVGQAMFAALVYLELFMICAITPAVTSGAISSEKEKQTYEMLMATPLSPTSILWGKMVSAMSYVLLLLFAGVPLASLVFIFGGVAPREMIRSLLVLLIVAGTLGILGMFYSALFGRTGRATVASFITVVLMMVGPLFLAVLVGVLRQSEPPRWILAPSPISALSAALSTSMNQNGMGSIFWILGGVFNMGIDTISMNGIPRPLYHYSIAIYAVLGLVLYLLATRLVRPTRRWSIRRNELIGGLLLVLIVGGTILAAYLITAPRYEWTAKPASELPVFDPPRPGIAPVPAEPVREEVVGVEKIPLTPTPTGHPGTNAAAPASFDALNIDKQAEIYAAVARQIYLVDHTFGDQPPMWEGLYLIRLTNDSVGDPNMPQSDAVVLPEELMGSVGKYLGDFPAKIMWVDSIEQVGLDPQNGTLDGGNSAAITFGNIYAQEDGTVQVSASLYFASLGAGGKTYILSNANGIWEVTGTTGVEWIS